MTYYNTPISTQTPAASQPEIQQNFIQIATSYNTDHVPFNTGGALQGFHKQVTISAPLAADPNRASTVSSLYTKTFAGATQLFFQNGALAANVAQLTGNATLSGTMYTVISPWGLIFKFGTGTAITAGVLQNFTPAFPTTCLGIVATAAVAGFFSPVSVVINSASQFTAYTQAGGAQSINFFAWGN